MKYLGLLSCIVLFSSACKKHQPPPNTPLSESPCPAIQLSSIPLNVGNMWAYDNGDTMRVVADTLINNIVAKKVVVNTGYAAATHVSYYSSQPEGVYLLGTNARPYSFMDPEGFVPDDNFTWFTTPMLLIKYPVAIGEQWDTNEPNMKYATRKWTGYVSIANTAGAFNCAKVEGDAKEYYSAGKGLVRVVVQPECFVAPCPPLVTNLVYTNF